MAKIGKTLNEIIDEVVDKVIETKEVNEIINEVTEELVSMLGEIPTDLDSIPVKPTTHGVEDAYEVSE